MNQYFYELFELHKTGYGRYIFTVDGVIWKNLYIDKGDYGVANRDYSTRQSLSELLTNELKTRMKCFEQIKPSSPEVKS